MNFSGRGQRLADVDLPRIGSKIGCGEDEIHAVLDVECAGSGFDTKNRPRMLFEPHIFWRELKGSSDKRNKALESGLAYPKWRRNYPSDSYPRLERAMQIDESAALRSASWGLGQIMGFNHKLAGYETVQAMVMDFTRSEAQQLSGMVEFIRSAKLDEHLRNHDWRGFAKGYNGPAYAKHGYHTRLERAYQKWKAIPDTDWKRSLAVVTTSKEPELVNDVSADRPAKRSIVASLLRRLFWR